ncbi:MAG: hypothetical protein JO250_12435 [Armatimonadetes bacterium]|nr:hypothetical protein [Armatimonadota bacterium]
MADEIEAAAGAAQEQVSASQGGGDVDARCTRCGTHYPPGYHPEGIEAYAAQCSAGCGLRREARDAAARKAQAAAQGTDASAKQGIAAGADAVKIVLPGGRQVALEGARLVPDGTAPVPQASPTAAEPAPAAT